MLEVTQMVTVLEVTQMVWSLTIEVALGRDPRIHRRQFFRGVRVDVWSPKLRLQLRRVEGIGVRSLQVGPFDEAT